MSNDNASTDFGYQRVSRREKTRKVGEVFSSVAQRYDIMNDAMSFGLHRLWKDYAIHLSALSTGNKVLDLAGGTGDMTRRILKRIGPNGQVVLADINQSMLMEGRDRLINQGHSQRVEYAQVNAEALPFPENTFDYICIAFGLRNVTDKSAALKSIYQCLKYGSQFMILEFSKMTSDLMQSVYDQYSFSVIPKMGKLIADDEESYQYLVESIRMHPGQEELRELMQAAGFQQVRYKNLTGGVVAVHTGYKL